MAQTSNLSIRNPSPIRIVKKTCLPLMLPFEFLYHKISHKEVRPKPSQPIKNLKKDPLKTKITILNTKANKTKLNFLASPI